MFHPARNLILVSSLLWFVPSVAAQVAWQVKPDPLPQAAKGPFDLKTTIPFAFMGKAIFPSTMGVFVAVNANVPKGQEPMVVVYDLRTMKPVGKPIVGKIKAGNLVLSPDGEYLAGMPDKSSVEIYSTAEGKSVRTIPLELTQQFERVELVDFAGKDRLFTIQGTPGKWVFQTWDLTTGKVVAEFKHGIEFIHWKWMIFSPGRRYFLLQETDGRTGYHLHFFETATGKQVGQIEMQDRKATWGQSSGIAFSPDGEELSLLWRLNNKECWAKMMVFDLKAGKKVSELKIDKLLPQIESLWFEGGTRSIQYMPDKSGWLLFGHLIVERETGTVVGKIGGAPTFSGVIATRRFLDADHIASGHKKGFNNFVKVEALPREEINAAIKKAREEAKKP